MSSQAASAARLGLQTCSYRRGASSSCSSSSCVGRFDELPRSPPTVAVDDGYRLAIRLRVRPPLFIHLERRSRLRELRIADLRPARATVLGAAKRCYREPGIAPRCCACKHRSNKSDGSPKAYRARKSRAAYRHHRAGETRRKIIGRQSSREVAAWRRQREISLRRFPDESGNLLHP